jgi:hypothetical protein
LPGWKVPGLRSSSVSTPLLRSSVIFPSFKWRVRGARPCIVPLSAQ